MARTTTKLADIERQLAEVAAQRDRLQRQVLEMVDDESRLMGAIASIKHPGMFRLLAAAHSMTKLRRMATLDEQALATLLSELSYETDSNGAELELQAVLNGEF